MGGLTLALLVLAGAFAFLVHATAVALANALRSYSRTRLEELCTANGRPGRAAEVVHQEEGTERATGLVAVLTGVALAAVLGGLVARTGARGLIDAGVIAALGLGALGHLAADIYGRVYAEPLLDRAWPVASAMRRLSRPLVFLSRWVEALVVRQARNGHGRRRPASLEVEITARTEEEAAHLETDLPLNTRAMIENVVALADRDVAELMTPRAAMVALPAAASLGEAARAFAESGLSRIPLYGEHRDDIVGILYAKDLLPRLATDEIEDNGAVRKLVRPALFVPETKNATDLLDELRQRRVQMAIILDEYGSVAGLITLEDLLEEIVGPIDDEHDEPEEGNGVRELDRGAYEVDAAVAIEDLNERLDLDLPIGDYQTVGGLAFDALGRVPEPGATFHVAGVGFTVLEVAEHAVRRLRLELEPSSERVSGV